MRSLPGLRADFGGLVALGPLGEAYATGVKDFVPSFGVFSPIAYFFAMVAQVFVAPILSAPVSLAGSLVFGAWEGFGLSLAGSIVGSTLAFLAVRSWGQPLVARLAGREAYRRYASSCALPLATSAGLTPDRRNLLDPGAPALLAALRRGPRRGPNGTRQRPATRHAPGDGAPRMIRQSYSHRDGLLGEDTLLRLAGLLPKRK